MREIREEAGLDVELEGILRVQHTPRADGQRLRVFFLARPADDRPPKSVPHEHSLETGWFSLDELARLPLRGDEVEVWARLVLGSPLVVPLSFISSEVP